MRSAELLTDFLDRVRDTTHTVLDGLGEDELTARLDADANTIAWLVWHASRVQDDHIAGVAGTEQVWTAQGFATTFGLPFDDQQIGYGQSTADVAHVVASASDLRAYADAVHDAAVAYVGTLSEDDLDRVVDERWDPPVTLGVRLDSLVNDATQHVGQAAYVRGLLERR